jgi:hypothetical protein
MIVLNILNTKVVVGIMKKKQKNFLKEEGSNKIMEKVRKRERVAKVVGSK